MGDHAGGLPSACEHRLRGAGAAGGELGGEPDPAAMAGEAPLDAGRLGRERETAPDRLTVEPAEYQRIIRRSGTAKRPYRAGGAVLQVADVGPLARLVCLGGANADPHPGAVGCSLYVAPPKRRRFGLRMPP